MGQRRGTYSVVVACMGQRRGTYSVVVGRPEGRRPLARQSKWHVWGRGEVHTVLWWGDLREGDHLQDTASDMYGAEERYIQCCGGET
jgi:hypothetical protein